MKHNCKCISDLTAEVNKNAAVFNFAKRMKEARLRKGLSQANLADITGISRQTIRCYERNGVEPGIYRCFLIAKAVGVSVDYLCCGPEV